MNQLTKHFKLEEFTASQTAARKGIDNTPPVAVVENLTRVAELLEQVREELGGNPISITSGYRCSALNKLVGSKPSSKHIQGLACDFKCPAFGSPYEIVRKLSESDIEFDQCILEFYNPLTGDGWVHLGLGAAPRRQVLTINSHGTFTGIHI